MSEAPETTLFLLALAAILVAAKAICFLDSHSFLTDAFFGLTPGMQACSVLPLALEAAGGVSIGFRQRRCHAWNGARTWVVRGSAWTFVL